MGKLALEILKKLPLENLLNISPSLNKLLNEELLGLEFQNKYSIDEISSTSTVSTIGREVLSGASTLNKAFLEFLLKLDLTQKTPSEFQGLTTLLSISKVQLETIESLSLVIRQLAESLGKASKTDSLAIEELLKIDLANKLLNETILALQSFDLIPIEEIEKLQIANNIRLDELISSIAYNKIPDEL